MRILIIHNKYLQKGGEDTVVGVEKNLLESKGHEVHLFCTDNAQILKNPVERIKSLFNCVYNLSVYKSVQKIIRSFQPDVVHVHNTFFVNSPSVYYAAKSLGVPVVQTLHNYRLICPSAYLYHKGEIYLDSVNKLYPIKAVLKRVWDNSFIKTWMMANITAIHKILGTYRNKVDKYIVFSEFSREVFQNSSLGLKDSQLVIKPNFVKDSETPFFNRDRGDFFLFVGRLSPEKGIETLLKAAQDSQIPIKIIGDGPMKAEVESSVSQNENLSYLGQLPYDEVQEFYRKAKALIFPSVWYEGMPMVLIEALAAGTPIVVSDLGNPGSMIEHERNGLKFEPGNSADMIKQLKRLLEEPGLPESLSRHARATYESSYSPEQNYQKLIGIYQEAIGHPNPKEILTGPMI